MDMADQLQKLTALHQQGALTDDEFALAKKKLIEGMQFSQTDRAFQSAQTESSNDQPHAQSRTPSALHSLRRARDDRWIGGVSGGLALATDIPAWSWRLLFVLMTLLHGFGILVYILLWIFVPLQVEKIIPRATVYENGGANQHTNANDDANKNL